MQIEFFRELGFYFDADVLNTVELSFFECLIQK